MKEIFLLFPALLFAFTLQPVWASDEESLGGPYSQFDPETGFYSSGKDQSAVQTSTHTPATPQPDTESPRPVATTTDEPPVSTPPANQSLWFVVIAVLMAGGIFGLRKFRNNSTNQ